MSFDSTDLDNAASESGVVHQSTTNTDHNSDSVLKQGYDYANFSEITPTPTTAFPFHEDSGTTAFDAAGANDGAIYGATQSVAGLLGTTAYSFDGTDDYIGAPAAITDGWTSGSGFSISIWVKFDNLTSGNRFVTARNHPSDANEFIALGTNTSGEYRFLVRDGSGNTSFGLNGVGSATTGTWTHLVANAFGDGTTELYENATLVSSAAGNATGDRVVTGTEAVEVGAGTIDGSYHSGDIADTRFINQTLTQTQVQTLYDVVATGGSLTTQFKTV